MRFIFSENGLHSYKDGVLISDQNIAKELGNEYLNKLINYLLAELSRIEVPVKRGNFIDFRKGMINVSPVGRSCSLQERLEFDKFNRENGVLIGLKSRLECEFGDKMRFSIGGQIGLDCFPHGWDKSYCLQFVSEYSEIYFMGDKTQ